MSARMYIITQFKRISLSFVCFGVCQENPHHIFAIT